MRAGEECGKARRTRKDLNQTIYIREQHVPPMSPTHQSIREHRIQVRSLVDRVVEDVEARYCPRLGRAEPVPLLDDEEVRWLAVCHGELDSYESSAESKAFRQPSTGRL